MLIKCDDELFLKVEILCKENLQRVGQWKSAYNRQQVFGFYVDEILCGACVLIKNNNQLFIKNLFVDKSYLHRGYGKQMLEEIENYYEDVTNLYCEVASDNRGAYEFFLRYDYDEINDDEESVYFQKHFS